MTIDCSYPEGNFGGNQLLDGSISLSPLYPNLTIDLHVRTAYEPPPEFPLASPYSGIVHHLSGPNMYAHTQTFLPKDCGRRIVPKRSYHCYFHYAREFVTPVLAHMLNSLVRVSRRGIENHFASITHACLSPYQHNTRQSSIWNRFTFCQAISVDTNPCWPTPMHSAPIASY